jgi:Mg2+/Co2+ transporter CorB
MESEPWILDVVATIVLLIIASYFSAAETGLTAVSRARIYKLVKEGDKRAKKVHDLQEHREELLGAILLSNTLLNILATAVSTAMCIALFGQEGLIYATIVLTVLVLIFGEILPKTFAIQNAEWVALFTAPVLTPLTRLLFPITQSIQWLIRTTLKLFGIDFNANHSLVSAADAIRGTIELHHQEGEVKKQARDMLGSILDLSEVIVGDVMTHRKQMEIVDAEDSAQEIIQQVVRSSHTRIPFWRDNQDNIIGVLHVKDIMRLIARLDKKVERDEILALLSPPWFVPETTTLSSQLLAFRQNNRHFAIVVDEYGACQGVITLEDILEEIVGDIVDEHDIAVASGVKKMSENTYRVKGTTTIRDINRLLDWDLPDDEAATVAGLVMHETRHIPEKGATFLLHGYRFTVEDKRANQIMQLIVERVAVLDEDT